jgi:hypothetical protein
MPVGFAQIAKPVVVDAGRTASPMTSQYEEVVSLKLTGKLETGNWLS